MRFIVATCIMLGFSSALVAQSMKKPSVPDPSILKIKKVKYRSHNDPGYMGLWDWNFSGGYISKKASPETISSTPLADQSTSGQYFMFHLQEGTISNYFLAKSYKKDKRFKFGLQNTFDLGFRTGKAVADSSNYAGVTSSQPGVTKLFFSYQLGLAGVIKITKNVDIGYTYYPYVYKSMFAPNVEHYSKLRFRFGPIMGEYSFGGKTAYELKYLRGKKLYIGASYTKTSQDYTTPHYYGTGTSNTNTNWFQLSLGRVF